MPQGPISVLNFAIRKTFTALKAAAVATFTSGTATALATDPNGGLIISGQGGFSSTLGMVGTQLIKAGPGMVIRVNVLVAGSAVGGVFDTAATAGLTSTADMIQQVATIPNSVGPIELDFPCLVGIAVQAGAGQVVSVSYQ